MMSPLSNFVRSAVFISVLLSLVSLSTSSFVTSSAGSKRQVRGSFHRLDTRQSGKASNGDQIKKLWALLDKSKPIEYAKQTTDLPRPTKIDYGPMPRHWDLNDTKYTKEVASLKFPSDFQWGLANAAAQVEGGVEDDGRGPSIWDSFAHRTPPGKQGMLHGETFDVAINFRHLYKLDLARVRAMGSQIFAFSISWSRVIPLGYGKVSQEGLQFYQDLIDEIKGKGGARPMEPMATIFHWDMPLQLELAYAGMNNSERFLTDWEKYVRTIFTAYGKSGIKKWITFNEPTIFCGLRYQIGRAHLQGQEIPSRIPFDYNCAAVLLKAHAKAYYVFKEMQNSGQIDKDAQISIKHTNSVNVPYDKDNKDDQTVVYRDLAYHMALFAEPIHKTGLWPELVVKELGNALPKISAADKIKGTADFFATDYYNAGLINATNTEGGLAACIGNQTHPKFPGCYNTQKNYPDGSPVAVELADPLTPWLYSTPQFLRQHLSYINKNYPTKGGIFLAEIGWAEAGEQNRTSIAEIIDDRGRQRYYRDHLEQMLLAIHTDKTPLKGVTLWSATSNVEWEVGLDPRFGVQSVDYKDPNLPRTFLNSFFLVREYFKKHCE